MRKMKPFDMKSYRMPHAGTPSRHYAKPRQTSMNTVVKGVVDVATIATLGGVTVGILNAIPKK